MELRCNLMGLDHDERCTSLFRLSDGGSDDGIFEEVLDLYSRESVRGRFGRPLQTKETAQRLGLEEPGQENQQEA